MSKSVFCLFNLPPAKYLETPNVAVERVLDALVGCKIAWGVGRKGRNYCQAGWNYCWAAMGNTESLGAAVEIQANLTKKGFYTALWDGNQLVNSQGAPVETPELAK